MKVKNTHLEDLLACSGISPKAYTLCGRIGIKTISGIQYFIKHKGDFFCFKDCSPEINEELLFLAGQYSYNPAMFRKRLRYERTLSHKEFVFFVKKEFNLLSTRAQNIIQFIFKNEIFNKEKIRKLFIERKFNPISIRNAGKKIAIELNKYALTIIELYYGTEKSNIPSLRKAFNEIEKITGIQENRFEYLRKYDEKEFPAISFVFENATQFLKLNTNRKKFLFKNEFFLLDRKFSSTDLKRKYSLTRERIRQNRKELWERFFVLSFLGLLTDHSYYKRVFKDKLVVDFSKKINNESLNEEIMQCGVTFSVHLLGLIYQEKYYCLSPLDKAQAYYIPRMHYADKYKMMKDIQGNYLISKESISKKSLLYIYWFILKELCLKRMRDKRIMVKDLVKESITPDSIQILKYILKNEMAVELNKDGSLIFKRNVPRQCYEYIQDILENIGEPVHLNIIYAELKRTVSNFSLSRESVRHLLSKHRDLFIYFSRSSIYGLRNWEREYPNIKGGSILQIAREFIQEKKRPCHIKEITDYINQYRITTRHSIRENIRNAQNHPFLRLGNGYFDLPGKWDNKEKRRKELRLGRVGLNTRLTN